MIFDLQSIEKRLWTANKYLMWLFLSNNKNNKLLLLACKFYMKDLNQEHYWIKKSDIDIAYKCTFYQ
jgi:hypothetical protein